MASRKSARSAKKGRRASGASPRRTATTRTARMVFDRRNYILLLVGIAFIVAGYAIMAFDNTRGFDAAGQHRLSLASPLSLVVAPLLLLTGYLELIVALLWRPKAAEGEETEETAAEPA